MGPVDHSFHFAKDRPTVIMLCGLQGSGKTTTAGKLALILREHGRKPLLVAADLQRPAAVEQLKVLGEQINVPVYSETPPGQPGRRLPQRRRPRQARRCSTRSSSTPPAGCTSPKCRWTSCGRSTGWSSRTRSILVCDAMTGQDAVNSAKAFNDALDLNGVILTKLDGDARGGAALSIKEVTKVPIKFIGVGEKLDRLEEFRPGGHGPAHPRPGRHHGPDREGRPGPAASSARRRLQKQQEKLPRATSRSTTSASSSSRWRRWGR